MKILVTGGAGFIGSYVVDSLIAEGHKVAVLDILSTGSMENLNPAVNFYHMDISDNLDVVFEKEQPEIVIHHAAQTDIHLSGEKPSFDAKVNILGTINLLDYCVKYNVNKFIYPSTWAVYGEPEYMPIDEKHKVKPVLNYGVSKLTSELYIQAYKRLHGLNYTILRYANVYGPRQSNKGEGGIIRRFANDFLCGKAPIIYGDGHQTRDFIFVKDVAKANLLALKKGDSQVINIGSGNQVSVKDLFNRFNSLFGQKVQAEYQKAISGDIKNSVFDITQADYFLDWQPEINLEEGLKETIEYYREIENSNENEE